MLNLLLKLKERKEYETQLIEYSKPFMSMSTESRESYFKRLDEAAKDFNEPIYQYFYWYKYWESMFLDVIIPLVRVCNLILRKRLCPILLEESESIEDFLPCTYPEAFIFFKKLDVSDRKTILQNWTDSYQYVDIMDCIERGDDVKFAIVFGKVENAVRKLSSIKFAKKILPQLIITNSILEAFAKDDLLKVENALKSLHLEEIEDGYDWSTIDGFCDFLDDSVCEDYPKIKNYTNMLRTDQESREIYEKLLHPCVQVTDFSNKQDLDRIKQIQSEWGNATEFTFFWKQFAELSFAFLCAVSFQNNKICLTEKERGVISAIVYNDDKAISSSRLLAIHRLTRVRIDEAYRTEQQQKCVPVLADRDFNSVRLIGSPYFEAAKKEGLIEDNGNNLEWKGTKVLLAYFCGRIYCGDYTKSPQRFREMPIWVSGGNKLPEAELNKLFDVKDLSQQRRNRTSNEETPPKGYMEIDAIIEAVNKTLK